MIRSVARAITRERAVLVGLAASTLMAIASGQLTKATAVPVLAGLVASCLTTPAKPGIRRTPPAHHDLRPLAEQAAVVAETDNSPRPGDTVDGKVVK